MESDKSISQGFKSKNNQQVERKLKNKNSHKHNLFVNIFNF